VPSPFPGMDPFVESPFWKTFHAQLIVEIARFLLVRVRPRYLVLTDERFVAEEYGDGIALTRASTYPDVGVVRAEPPRDHEPAQSIATAPLQIATTLTSRYRQRWIEVRDSKTRRLVTVIELLSPDNKTGKGRRQYLRRRERFLRSSVHLLEIDLHRAGKRVPVQSALPSASYFVFLSRAENRPVMDVWPIDLRSHLPSVHVPLLPEDGDVLLDLQQVFTTVYGAVGGEQLVDYSEALIPPLNQQDTAWVDEVLHSAGLRT
jgi:hypothetical protein